ncbi:MAG TPA: DUF1844 domain-containing protein [Polyangia bacterium]|jgi:hypothetical protein
MASGNEDEKKPGFTVSDRRAFASGAGESADAPVAGPAGEAAADLPSSSDLHGASSGDAYPPIDFHTFILSLGSSTLYHLGELDGPDGAPGEVDLPLAAHTIDVIAMLQEKTKGNLTPPEANLVESLLYDLRLRYVEKSKASG